MTTEPKNEREQIERMVDAAYKEQGDGGPAVQAVVAAVLCDFRRMTAAQERIATALEKISTFELAKVGEIMRVAMGETTGHTEIFGIPTNAPHEHRPGDFSPVKHDDPRFKRWRPHDAELGTSYRPEIYPEQFVYWKDGGGIVHGPVLASTVNWACLGHNLLTIPVAYFAIPA